MAANAGVGGGGRSPSTETTTEQWRRVTMTNLDGVFWTLREASRHMMTRAEAGDPGGSRAWSRRPRLRSTAPRNQAYASTKGAVIAMDPGGIAVEYARYGVRANAILPGWIRTDMTAAPGSTTSSTRRRSGACRCRRWGEPEDFAGIAVYLASDASRFHTGDSFVIDGGYTIF